jgi:hypothetical protein
MKTDETNREWIAEHVDDTVLIACGFDSSIVGYTVGCGCTRVVYDAEIMVQSLVEDGCDPEEALEYLEFNTFGAYVGEGSPIYVNRIGCIS